MGLRAVPVQRDEQQAAERGDADESDQALRAGVGACQQRCNHKPPPDPGALFRLGIRQPSSRGPPTGARWLKGSTTHPEVLHRSGVSYLEIFNAVNHFW